MIHVDVVVGEDETNKRVVQDRQSTLDMLVEETKEHLHTWDRLEECLWKTIKDEIDVHGNITKFIFDETNQGIYCDFLIRWLLNYVIIHDS